VVVPVDTPDATDDWDTAAVLVRPDQHVAWRGDDPAAVAAALDRAVGHAHTNSVAA
jgi:hypothetical protein